MPAHNESYMRFLVQINDLRPSEREKLDSLQLVQIYFDPSATRAFAIVRANGPGQAIGKLHQSLVGVSTILLSQIKS